jgi:hypothetical protein
MLGNERRVSGLKQYMEIFRREILNTTRNPRAFKSTIFNSIFIGLLNLSLYFKVGQLDHNDYNI